MTNGEKIREMSDKELAQIIMCPYDGSEILQELCTYEECIKCSEEWIKRETE